MALALTDFHDSFVLRGATPPVANEVPSATRTLTLAGTTTTPPRTASYTRRRGAEFRTSSFSASSPQALATAASGGLNTALYVSSKIQSFTWIGWVRANKSGVSSIALTPLGGIVSANNVSGAANVYNQPCVVLTVGTAGSSRIIVSVMGAILDTAIATQTSGSTSTAPLEDAAWNIVAVRVTGDSGTDNTVTSVTLFHMDSSGNRRTYSLGAHRAAARFDYSTSVNLSNNDTIVVNGRTYTAKTALSSTPATGLIANGGSTNPTPGSTITIGDLVYTFASSVGAAAKASGSFLFNSAKTVAKTDKAVDIVIGGYAMKFISGTDSKGVSGYPSGSIKGYSTLIDKAAEAVHECVHGTNDGVGTLFQVPKSPTTGTNAGKDWSLSATNSRDFSTKFSSHSSDTIYTLTIEALAAGTAGNSITLDYTDPNTTKVISSKSGATLSGGTADPVARSILVGVNWAATRANVIAAVNAAAGAGTTYSADITTANPKVTAATSGGTDIGLTAKLLGTAGNGIGLAQSAATFTLTAFSGGVDGADADQILIGATPADSWSNLVAALNLTGARGQIYGSPTTINADVTASIPAAGSMLVVGKATGSAGNSVTLSKSTTPTVTIRDEFGDKTVTTLTGGSNAPSFVAAAGARPDNADLRLMVGGWTLSPLATAGTFYGTVGDTAIANRVLTDDECAGWGSTPPPVSTRDKGWYRAASKVRISMKGDSQSTWPVPQELSTGTKMARVQGTCRGSRLAFRLWGVEAGRPFSATRFTVSYEREKGMTAAQRGYYEFPQFVQGDQPGKDAPNVDAGAFADGANISHHKWVAKRRRGYRILANAGTSVSGTPCAFYDATNASGQTWHLYFAGGTIYAYDNGNLTSLDTGWSATELPTCATVGNKTFFASSGRKRVFIDGSFFDVGVTAPTDAPLFVSSASADGGVLATSPGVEYVYTHFDGTKLTDSGPSPITKVLLPAGSVPSSIVLSCAISASSTVTKRNIWRRRFGESTFILVGSIEDNTTTAFTDSDEVPGTTEILGEFDGVAVTAEFPDVTAVASFDDMLLAWGGDDLRFLYVSEPGDGERWWPVSILTAQSAIRGALAQEGRVLIFTDKTVEAIEGDFLRSESGGIGITRRILDTSKGSFGPFASATGAGRVWWADAGGINTMGAGQDQRDVTQKVSWPVDPLVQNAVDTLGTNVVMAFNHVSNQLWICLSQADASTSTKNRIVLVYDVAQGTWCPPFDHSLSWVTRVVDGTYGTLFLGCDYNGGILELDVYDGDGCQGNESWYPASPAFSAVSVSGKTVTFSGASFTTDALRGVSALFEDVSAGTFTRQTILSNTGTVLTLDDVPAAMVVGDKCHIGGIKGYFETKDSDFGINDVKKIVEVEVGFTDATLGGY